MILILQQLSPAILGLLAASGAWLVHWRTSSMLPRASQVWTGVGMGFVLGCAIGVAVWNARPFWVPELAREDATGFGLVRFIIPLLLCVIALLFLIPPARVAGPRGAAELSRRTLLSFAPTFWAITSVVVTVVVFVVGLLSGMASSPDEAGRYVLYTVTASASTTASTTMYGWFYVVPSLALVAVIGIVTIVQLAFISRPPLASERGRDLETRTTRSRNVLAVTTGGLLLHLGAVLQSLSATSSLQLGFESGTAGWVELGTSFAALGPMLLTASYVTTVGGFAVWWITLLTAAGAWKRQPATDTVVT